MGESCALCDCWAWHLKEKNVRFIFILTNHNWLVHSFKFKMHSYCAWASLVKDKFSCTPTFVHHSSSSGFLVFSVLNHFVHGNIGLEIRYFYVTGMWNADIFSRTYFERNGFSSYRDFLFRKLNVFSFFFWFFSFLLDSLHSVVKPSKIKVRVRFRYLFKYLRVFVFVRLSVCNL